MNRHILLNLNYINKNSSTVTTNFERWKKEFEENSKIYNKYVLAKS